MKKAAVFEETYRNYLSQVGGIDLISRAARLGAEVSGNALILPFYGKPFRISKNGITDETGKRADFGISVVICRYVLSCPAEIPLAGDWTAYREFKDAGPLIGYFTSNTQKKIETVFAGNVETLKSACLNLGGRVIDGESACDLAVTFDCLPRLPVYLRFNDKDDEFPALCTILFRRSAEAYIDMESLAIGATYLAGMLTAKKAVIFPTPEAR